MLSFGKITVLHLEDQDFCLYLSSKKNVGGWVEV
jgi:hypothetical protein